MILGKGLKPEICIEIKLSSAPSLTRSFTTAIGDLQTKQNYIIIPEGTSYRIREDIKVCGIREFCEIML